MSKKLAILPLFLIFSFAFSASLVFAQGSNGSLSYTPLEPIPLLSGIENANSNLGDLLNGSLRILVIAGGFMAVGLLVFYGIEYMMTDVVTIKTVTRGHIRNAAWGLLLLLGAYLILYTVNPTLLNFSNIFSPTGSLAGSGTLSSGGASGGSTPSAATLNQDATACNGYIVNGTCRATGQ